MDFEGFKSKYDATKSQKRVLQNYLNTIDFHQLLLVITKSFYTHTHFILMIPTILSINELEMLSSLFHFPFSYHL